MCEFNQRNQAGSGSTRTGTAHLTDCYAAETLISTPDGDRPVGALRVGDRVSTADHGAQPIRWITAQRVPAFGRHAPVRIPAGALGTGLPRRDLLVTVQHRLLVRSRVAAEMFGADEVYMPAKKLIGYGGIAQCRQTPFLTFVHFLCDRHEVVFAEGAPSESLYPGPLALDMMGEAARRDLAAKYPLVAGALEAPEPARPFVPGARHRDLLEAHDRAGLPLLDNRLVPGGHGLTGENVSIDRAAA